MRKAMIVAALPLAACGAVLGSANGEEAAAQASGTATSRSYQMSGFDGVSLRGPDSVDVHVGPGFAIRADGPSEELDQLELTIKDGKLRIGRKTQRRWFGGGGHHKALHLTVSLPRLQAADIAGSGTMNIDRVQGAFSGSIAGSGDLNVTDLRGPSADLSIAGSGDMRLSGSVDRLKASIAGSGDVDGRGLHARSADVSIMGSGNLLGQVDGPATISIMGSGDVTLGKGAQCSVNRMGSGSAHCG